MKRNRTIAALAAFALVVASCGGGEDAEDTTTAPTTTARATTTTTQATTTTSQTTTATTAEETTTTTLEAAVADCLPIASALASDGDRDKVGEITDRYNRNVEVDCVKVSGGEELFERAVLATDAGGETAFATDDVESCRLSSRSEIVLRPEDIIVLRVVQGEVFCTIEPGDTAKRFAIGNDTAVFVDPDSVTTVSMLIADDGESAEIQVFTGFTSVYQPLLGCATVAGPLQRATVTPGLPPVIQTLDLNDIADLYRPPIEAARGNLDPPVISDEMLPGLSDILDASEATFLVDGELIDPSVIVEAEPVLGLVTGSELSIARPGRIEIIRERPIDQLPEPIIIDTPLLDPGEIILPGPIIDLPLDRLQLLDVLEAEPIAPIAVDLFVDPQGKRWTMAYDEADEELNSTIQATLAEQIASGTYGAYYEQVFNVAPDYGQLFPDLLMDFEPCLDQVSE